MYASCCCDDLLKNSAAAWMKTSDLLVNAHPLLSKFAIVDKTNQLCFDRFTAKALF